MRASSILPNAFILLSSLFPILDLFQQWKLGSRQFGMSFFFLLTSIFKQIYNFLLVNKSSQVTKQTQTTSTCCSKLSFETWGAKGGRCIAVKTGWRRHLRENVLCTHSLPDCETANNFPGLSKLNVL